MRQLDFHGEELRLVDAELARVALASEEVKRLIAIPGVDATVALSILVAVGDFGRFCSPQRRDNHPRRPSHYRRGNMRLR